VIGYINTKVTNPLLLFENLEFGGLASLERFSERGFEGGVLLADPRQSNLDN